VHPPGALVAVPVRFGARVSRIASVTVSATTPLTSACLSRSLPSRLLSPDGTAIVPTRVLAVDPGNLLERFEWNKGIRDDIPGLGALDVKRLLDSGVRCVTQLMGLKNEITDENILEQAAQTGG
jgi:hypothetical protein